MKIDNKTILILLSLVYLSSVQASLAECPDGTPLMAEPLAPSAVSGVLSNNEALMNAMFNRAPALSQAPQTASRAVASQQYWAQDPQKWQPAQGTLVMPTSLANGHLSADHITMDANQSFQNMIKNPIAAPTFEQDVAGILAGTKPMIQAVCQCKYQEHDGGQTQNDGEIVAYGASNAIAAENAMRGCFQDAYTAEAGALDLKNHSVDDLWGKIGHVQSVNASQCTYSPFKFDLNFLANYKNKHNKDILQAERSLDGQRSMLGQACFGDHFPDWAKTTIAMLNGGWSWRARGGAIATGNDNIARIGFGYLPLLLTSCIAAKDMKGFVDGAVMSTFMLESLYVNTWSHLQGAGGITSCDPTYVNHGSFGGGRSVCSGSLALDNAGEAASMSVFGYQMETFLSMAYAQWRGYDPSYLAMAGLAWGPCTAGFNADQRINSTWFNREDCWGAANHVGIALTLEKGQVRDVDNNGPADLINNAGPEAKQFLMDLENTGLVHSAVIQNYWNTPDMSNLGQNPTPQQAR